MSRSKEDLSKLTVAELKAALKELGLPVTGKKEELVERLFAAEQASVAKPDKAAAPAAETTAPVPAEEAPVAPTDPAPTAETSGKEEKHAKIVFSDEAIKAMPTKLTVIKSVEVKPIKSDAEKLKERAEKFKDPAVEKAKQRAERFGIAHPELEKEKARKRAERFGTHHPDIDEERKAKRAERFGIEDPEAKLQHRAARFGVVIAPATSAAASGAVAAVKAGRTPIAGPVSSDFEAAKKARAARFGAA